MDYLYDGTFEGLLTCIYWNYYEEKTTGIYIEKEYQQSIVYQNKKIVTDKEKAKKVFNAIEEKITEEALNYVYYSFLSDYKEKENIILEFLRHGFSTGINTLKYYSHEKVFPIYKLYNKVGMERHRLLGLLRFADMKGILYAKYCPDHNISVIIADHFADRLKNEKFIIHDVKRNIAVVSYNGKWQITDFYLENELEYSKEEVEFQKLWRGYFNQIAIKDRENINLQFNFVPARYRKNLVEFKLV